MDLSNIEFFFFDIEDTLIKWNDTVLGAEDLIHTLEDKNKKIFFHTNNSLLTRKQLADKLSEMEINASKNQILTSTYVAARYLKKNEVKSVYSIGEEGVLRELQEQDISIRKESENIVVGLDRQFNYSKLSKIAAKDDPKIYVCGDEKYLNLEDEGIPGTRPINRAIEVYGETELVGKPSQHFIDVFRDYFSFMPDNSLFVGDRLSDIEVGNKLGMNTALLMSGTTSKAELSEAESPQKPNVGISNLTRLTRKLNH